MPKRINLVLGSGGARGLAHIGVIKELISRDYRICSITACSMGALVGGLYAAGGLDDYEQWMRQLTRWDVLRFMDFSMGSSNGMMKGDKIMEKLSGWIGDVQIEDLDIPFTAVAADINSRKEVWIHSGSLVDAIRASISVPGVFTPQVIKNRVLVDGGILNPLPIPPATIDGDIKTLAVSLAGNVVPEPFGKVRIEERNPREPGDGSIHQRIERFLDLLSGSFGSDNSTAKEEQLSMTDVMLGMFSTMQDTLSRHRLASTPPDILIEIPANICGTHEYFLANELIPAGAYWARRALGANND